MVTMILFYKNLSQILDASRIHFLMCQACPLANYFLVKFLSFTFVGSLNCLLKGIFYFQSKTYHI